VVRFALALNALLEGRLLINALELGGTLVALFQRGRGVGELLDLLLVLVFLEHLAGSVLDGEAAAAVFLLGDGHALADVGVVLELQGEAPGPPPLLALAAARGPGGCTAAATAGQTQCQHDTQRRRPQLPMRPHEGLLARMNNVYHPNGLRLYRTAVTRRA